MANRIGMYPMEFVASLGYRLLAIHRLGDGQRNAVLHKNNMAVAYAFAAICLGKA